MSTWDDKPNDYLHALQTIERLRDALRTTNNRLAKLVNETGDLCWKDNPDGWTEAQQQVLANRELLK